MSKFRNTKTVIDGIAFASKKEAARYIDLRLLQAAREIVELQVQPTFRLEVNGQLVCKYVADFSHRDPITGALTVEDVKSPITRKHPVYRIKVKLLKALTGLSVVEV